jgi:Predicted metal-dependent hydrolase with the TIM-barrel fold
MAIMMKQKRLLLIIAVTLGTAAILGSCTTRKADLIIKNAKIFTSDQNNPQATALVVKDGRFVYVGNEAGLAKYEGEVRDMGGKFIMPGIIDSHLHLTMPVGFEYAPMRERIEPDGKKKPCA